MNDPQVDTTSTYKRDVDPTAVHYEPFVPWMPADRRTPNESEVTCQACHETIVARRQRARTVTLDSKFVDEEDDLWTVTELGHRLFIRRDRKTLGGDHAAPCDSVEWIGGDLWASESGRGYRLLG